MLDLNIKCNTFPHCLLRILAFRLLYFDYSLFLQFLNLFSCFIFCNTTIMIDQCEERENLAQGHNVQDNTTDEMQARICISLIQVFKMLAVFGMIVYGIFFVYQHQYDQYRNPQIPNKLQNQQLGTIQRLAKNNTDKLKLVESESSVSESGSIKNRNNNNYHGPRENVGKPLSSHPSQLPQSENPMTRPPNKPHSEIIKMHDPMDYTDPLPSSFLPQQLPFCIVTFNVSEGQLANINHTIQEIKTVNSYTNLKHIHESNRSPSLTDLYDLITTGCEEKSISLLVAAPLRLTTLHKINELYQRKLVWLTYQKRDGKLLNGVSSFFSGLMRMIPRDQIASMERDGKGVEFIIKSLMKLAKYRAAEVLYKDIFYADAQREGVDFYHGKINPFLSAATPTPAMSLWEYPWASRYNTHNYERYVIQQIKQQTEKKVQYEQEDADETSPVNSYHSARNSLTLAHIRRSIEYMELKSLPKEHSLFVREKHYYSSKYTSFPASEELPLCIIVPSWNNMEGERYKKCLSSILQQSYDNYHIVYIDDASDDGTYQASKDYVGEQMQALNKEIRVDFIRNEGKKFASYNIYQGVKGYCKEEREIVVLVDGDDELIGTQVFNLINTHYQQQQKQNWIVYFSFMSSDFGYGVSKPPQAQEESGARTKYHIFGALRTFYARLYLKIDVKDHQDENGEFLTTLYDDAMQYPLFEMAGLEHISYVPEILYFYNRFYGGNDDSSRAKERKRAKQHEQILSRAKYHRVYTLF